MIADIFTKYVKIEIFEKHVRPLEMRRLDSCTSLDIFPHNNVHFLEL